MANTVTQRTLLGGGSEKNVVRLITITSDGSEEADLVVYDNSDFVNDVNKGTLVGIKATGSSCQVQLEWDQTTDSTIMVFDPSNGVDFCFRKWGGIANPKEAGATGDILLSTAGLDSGDVVTIILEIKQS